MVVRVRGYALPDGEYADGDRWTTDPVPGASVVAEGWLLPGLVDAHTHPGAVRPGDPLDTGGVAGLRIPNCLRSRPLRRPVRAGPR